MAPYQAWIPALLLTCVISSVVNATARLLRHSTLVLSPDNNLYSSFPSNVNLFSEERVFSNDTTVESFSRFAAALESQHLHWPGKLRSKSIEEFAHAAVRSATARDILNDLSAIPDAPHESGYIGKQTAADDDSLLQLKLAFITSWVQALQLYVGHLGVSKSNYSMALHATSTQLANVTQQLLQIARTAADNPSILSNHATISDTRDKIQRPLNSQLRPEAVELVKLETILRGKHIELSERLDVLARKHTILTSELNLWLRARDALLVDIARRKDVTAAAEKLKRDLDELSHLHAQVAALSRPEAIEALGDQYDHMNLNHHTEAHHGQAQTQAQVVQPPVASPGAIAAAANATTASWYAKPGSITPPLQQPTNASPSIQPATDVSAAVAKIVPSSPCPSELDCLREQQVFAAATTVNYQYSTAASLTLLSLHKNRLVRAKIAGIHKLYSRLFMGLRQKIFAKVIAGFDGEEYDHPGGAAALLCFYIELPLRDHCSNQIINAIAESNTHPADMVYCTLRAQAKKGRANGDLGPICEPYFEAISQKAKEIAKGMHGSFDSALDDVKAAIKEVVQSMKDAVKTRQAAAAALRISKSPFGFPSSPVEANILALDFMYQARRNAYYMSNRQTGVIQHKLRVIAAQARLDYSDVLADKVDLPPSSSVKKRIDELLAALDASKTEEEFAEKTMKLAEMQLLAAQGRVPPKPLAEDLSSAQANNPTSAPLTKTSLPDLSCPVGNVFCPSIPGSHARFWDIFNSRRGAWRPDGTEPSWVGSDIVLEKPDDIDGALRFLEIRPPTRPSCLESRILVPDLCGELVNLHGALAPLFYQLDEAGPDPYDDIYPDLYYPPTSVDDNVVKTISMVATERDSSLMGKRQARALPVGAMLVRSQSTSDRAQRVTPSSETNNVEDRADAKEVSSGRGRDPPLLSRPGSNPEYAPPPKARSGPIQPGERVFVTKALPVLNLPIAVALKPQEVEGYVTGVSDEDPTKFDITLLDGSEMKGVGASSMKRPEAATGEGTKLASRKSPFVVDRDWLDTSSWPPRRSFRSLEKATAQKKRNERRCWFFGLFCRTVTVHDDSSLVSALQMKWQDARRVLYRTPTELFAVASTEIKCECLCPVPRNAKLNAYDCADLARLTYDSKVAEDKLADQNGDVFDATTRFRIAESLAQNAQLRGGPQVKFLDPDGQTGGGPSWPSS